MCGRLPAGKGFLARRLRGSSICTSRMIASARNRLPKSARPLGRARRATVHRMRELSKLQRELQEKCNSGDIIRI
jgi:hypothetical protein